MAELFLNITNVILPVLICAAVGYGLAIAKIPFDKNTISGLVTNVGYPTLIISHLSKRHVNVAEFLDFMLAAALAVICFGVIGFVVLKLMRLPIRSFLSPMMLNNVGNIGLPVALLAFGNAGMAFAMAYVVVVVVGIFTVGMWLPMGRFSIRDLLTSPIIYSVILTLILMSTGYELPKTIGQAFDILGGLSIPLMLLTLGYTLATLKFSTLWLGLALSVIHVAMAAAVAAAIVWLFGFTGVQKGAFVVSSLMPVSVATYLFVERYTPEHTGEVASFILVSTLLTIVVLTVALTVWV
ncbi:MAG: hypothetical protein MnENMB40S_00580 [Rhizobiaceae bacterium MnEN-MB40S]|nr:MAG: hypothetical protein MnENMB40S_00580 [Rhizobiaceae bacterium MnEN-MB40S]